MSEVVLHRVDDRLIHGQVMTGWLGLRNANAIWIVDDAVATSPMMLNVFRFAAPASITVVAYTIDQAAAQLTHLQDGNQRIIMLTKRPQTFQALHQQGYNPAEINIGAMAHKPGALKVAQNCELLPEEIDALEALHKDAIRIWVQLVPFGGHKPQEWADLRRKLGRS